MSLENFIRETEELTHLAVVQGDTADSMFLSLGEELGELAAALSSENGRKKRDLKEDSKVEAIDVVVTALSIFFAKGGTVEELSELGIPKLKKWAKKLDARGDWQPEERQWKLGAG